MLNHDEEEILKILLNLSKEQKSLMISGSFTDFPVKYQIVYKEIIKSLERCKFIAHFEDFIADDFLLTLLPSAVTYFRDKAEIKNKKSNGAIGINHNSIISELEALIAIKGGDDKSQLTDIAEEIREYCDNLKSTPTIQPRKMLIKKIGTYSKKYPWFMEKIVKIFGFFVMELMAGL